MLPPPKRYEAAGKLCSMITWCAFVAAAFCAFASIDLASSREHAKNAIMMILCGLPLLACCVLSTLTLILLSCRSRHYYYVHTPGVLWFALTLIAIALG